MHVGVESSSIFFKAEMTHFESPIQEAEPKPPLYNETSLDISLEHSNKPDTSDLEIVNPFFSGVTRDLVARM